MDLKYCCDCGKKVGRIVTDKWIFNVRTKEQVYIGIMCKKCTRLLQKNSQIRSIELTK